MWLRMEVENSGPGDAQMSSLFQANLRGNTLRDSPLEIAIGSRATLKNMGYGGGLLHSHVQTYPEGSGQQQVTCYHHKDSNNDWFFYPARSEPTYDENSEELRFVQNKDVIRLIHAQTGRNLHSHSVSAPVTKADYEVSSYGNLTVPMALDVPVRVFVIRVVGLHTGRFNLLETPLREIDIPGAEITAQDTVFQSECGSKSTKLTEFAA